MNVFNRKIGLNDWIRIHDVIENTNIVTDDKLTNGL